MSRSEDRCTETITLVIHPLLHESEGFKRFDRQGFFHGGFATARQLIEQTAFEYVRALLRTGR